MGGNLVETKPDDTEKYGKYGKTADLNAVIVMYHKSLK